MISTLSTTRIRAVVGKEIRDYRRNRFIATTMAIMPILFMIAPIVTIFSLPADVASQKLDAAIGVSVLYLTLIPALVPAVVASYTIVGEREQGTLEPVLTTPLTREELLLGKALAAFLPTLVISYAMYGIFLACAGLFAHPNVSDDIFQAGRILAQVLFTPLLAAWSIWAGIAISTRASDVRVAQQLSTLVSLPPLAVTALMGFGVITPSLRLALILGLALLAIDVAAGRFVAKLFDRERLLTGVKA
ncbi:ABC transporter permease [Actinospica sp. MGRD01-02]|uniref:ABC transporter permease n=1 Tax=Actinospica acidithermotolerans TaxID=2828514 RepID=A0A941E9X3_9ACTN|nr:ABC transporter permease [Actinospica acidithermotolerans]MBR7827656.1 ABC transporter permease [Actinospica acidithermotolerans]